MKQKSLALTIFALLNASVVCAAPESQVSVLQSALAQNGAMQQPVQAQPQPQNSMQSAMPTQPMPNSMQATDENGQKQTVIVDQNGNLKVMNGSAPSAASSNPNAPANSPQPMPMPMVPGQAQPGMAPQGGAMPSGMNPSQPRMPSAQPMPNQGAPMQNPGAMPSQGSPMTQQPPAGMQSSPSNMR